MEQHPDNTCSKFGAAEVKHGKIIEVLVDTSKCSSLLHSFLGTKLHDASAWFKCHRGSNNFSIQDLSFSIKTLQ